MENQKKKEKKVIYSLLLRIYLQEENVYTVLGDFFDFKAIF
jgi:hypothetical protein